MPDGSNGMINNLEKGKLSITSWLKLRVWPDGDPTYVLKPVF